MREFEYFKILMNNRKTGNHGEGQAVKYLKSRNHIIVARNFLTKVGEIDIISILNKNLYIYEVKLRQNLEYGFGDDSITKSKINKIRKAFEIWQTEDGKTYQYENIFLNALIIDPDGKINEFEFL